MRVIIENLRDFHIVKKFEKERGFEEDNILHKCLLLGEEIGELFKAIRKRENLKIDTNSKVGDISEELADIMMYLCAIANRYNIDLERAFRDKEQRNQKRTWQ